MMPKAAGKNERLMIRKAFLPMDIVDSSEVNILINPSGNAWKIMNPINRIINADLNINPKVRI